MSAALRVSVFGIMHAKKLVGAVNSAEFENIVISRFRNIFQIHVVESIERCRKTE